MTLQSSLLTIQLPCLFPGRAITTEYSLVFLYAVLNVYSVAIPRHMLSSLPNFMRSMVFLIHGLLDLSAPDAIVTDGLSVASVLFVVTILASLTTRVYFVTTDAYIPHWPWYIVIPVGLLIVTAFLGKLVGAGLPALWSGLGRPEALAVGAGMGARGAGCS